MAYSNPLTTLDTVALGWFLLCWVGYTHFARFWVRYRSSLTSVLRMHRHQWMLQMLGREQRNGDVIAVGNLQRNVTFFASTTIFILAGLLAVLGASDQAIELINTLPYVTQNSREEWEIKVFLLLVIFIYAFFKFSWSVRQYNFALVLIGSAPHASVMDEGYRQAFAEHANDVLSRANDSFNFGLRAYQFSMATLAWFVQPWLFMAVSAWVVAILYRREFRSKSLRALKAILKASNDNTLAQVDLRSGQT